MFRSVYNLRAAERGTIQGRQRHDFVDDLESFFWVYAYMMTVHNGPGMKRLIPQSERSAGVRDWATEPDPGFHRSWKLWYLEHFNERRYAVFTPYFSKPVYQTLLHDLRTLLHSYLYRKMERPEDEHGNRPEIDLFPEIEEIYSKVLGCFDVAIAALSPPPKAPPRTQPDRQVKLVKRRQDEDSGPPSLPKLPKRGRIAHPDRQLKRQRTEGPTSSSLLDTKRVRVDPPSRTVPPTQAVLKTTPSIPLNIRRSSRLRAGS